MAIEIVVPRLGWSMEKGAFVAWLKKDGEFVRAGEPIFSIEGDKAVQEIESIDSGILRIAANSPKPGDSIRVGDLLGHLVSADAPATESVSASTVTTGTQSPSREAQPTGTPLPGDSDGFGGTVQMRPQPIAISPTVMPQVPPENVGRPKSIAAISPRALRVAAELGVDWTTVSGSGRTGRIREKDIRAAAGADGYSVASVGRLDGHSVAADGTNPTFLVTGGCGFIGTWVIRELLRGGFGIVVLDAGERPARWMRVIGSDSEHVPLVQGSLLDRQVLARVFAEHDVTHVIHLAALLTPACQTDPWEGCQVNVLGSLALFEQVRTSATRICGVSYASSVAVFGDEPDHTRATVDGRNQPLTFYGAFKKSVELIAAQYWRQFQIASVGIRPQVAYGPEREAGLTAGPSLAARAAASGEAFSIGYTGRVGYDYVEDVARAFVRGALKTPPGAHLVDLPGAAAEVEEVIAAIRLALPGATPKLSVKGPAIPAHVPPNPCYISTLYPDWKTTSLLDGIRQTVEFYRKPQTEKLL